MQKKSQIAQIRSFNYKAGKVLGDVRAVQTGRIAPRIGQRVAGKYTRRGMNKMFK